MLHLQVGAIVFGDKGAVALAQHSYLLLNIFNLVLSFLQVNDLDGHHFLSPIVNAFEDLAERTLANALQLGEELLWIHSDILLRMDKYWYMQSRAGQCVGCGDKDE